jgi:hypothetical protein
VIEAAATAADAFGLHRHYRIRAVRAAVFAASFDPDLFNTTERKEYDEDRRMHCADEHGPIACLFGRPDVYVEICSEVSGGGCIAEPTVNVPATRNDKPVPTGVTNMRCGKTEEEFERIARTVAPRV